MSVSLDNSFLSPRLIREERPNISVALPPKAEQALRAATAQPDQSLNAQSQRRMIAGASSPHLAFETEYADKKNTGLDLRHPTDHLSRNLPKTDRSDAPSENAGHHFRTDL